MTEGGQADARRPPLGNRPIHPSAPATRGLSVAVLRHRVLRLPPPRPDDRSTEDQGEPDRGLYARRVHAPCGERHALAHHRLHEAVGADGLDDAREDPAGDGDAGDREHQSGARAGAGCRRGATTREYQMARRPGIQLRSAHRSFRDRC